MCPPFVFVIQMTNLATPLKSLFWLKEGGVEGFGILYQKNLITAGQGNIHSRVQLARKAVFQVERKKWAPLPTQTQIRYKVGPAFAPVVRTLDCFNRLPNSPFAQALLSPGTSLPSLEEDAEISPEGLAVSGHLTLDCE
uniref:Uncharacterized protein n=1 Tax=Chromera velia CCMP2878 TaxID=1169474 RepID=A0A0K6SA09_9ALVE|eukprot:Cvel_31556.t1-p1 / transcript=Cvel_31556.t1 / gene=Cvel_31556 / organism=Chromera_velia_CCMP2878 / gene_product=hypothetical protein / transcript_product=hypothetical protein / location=Cvel_scaffold4725:4795-5208(+) / protein_length=138 / sequence_SO=supercontig / SO=protein_coding / is_pseudo=false